MKTVLVHPAGSNWIPGQTDVSAVVNRMAPLGLLSLAAYLRRQGHPVAVHDTLGPFAPRSLEGNVGRVLRCRPDLVGFSATTSSFLDAAEMARRIKDLRPEIVTVVGGVGVSSVGPALLARFPEIDFLVLGEGEQTLEELVSGSPPEQVRGLAYRSGSEARVTDPRPPIADLDSLPFPAYGDLEGFPRRYHLPLFNTPAAPGAAIATSRGCPYQCSYCDRSVFRKGFRFHGAEYIREHMAFLAREFGVRHVNVYDDLFTFDRPRVVELCRLLIRGPLGMTFNCSVRVGHADAEMLRLLKKAGAWMVSVGIESGDPDLVEKLKAGVTLEQVRDTVERIRQAGLKVKGLFMAGVPGETPASLARTSEFMLSLNLDEMSLSKFTPFHGAPVWPRIREHGSFEEDWLRMNCNNFVFVPKGFSSKAQLERAYAEAIHAFYFDRGYRRRWVRRLWTCRHSLYVLLRHLPSMLQARHNFDPARIPVAAEGKP